jgi:hypothetical protein
VLVRSIVVEREPIYRHQETVGSFAAEAFGLERGEAHGLTDDVLGRALDRLFDADRGSLLTEVVIAVRRRFGVEFDELHNDSTTVRFTGQYRGSRGRRLRGRRVPWITYGYSKDHRPDLKQLLYVLTTSADGGIPVQFRCADGNTNDATTHIETWEALRAVAGRADFLYVADSKLCTMETMEHLDRHGGRFVTVMPRSRLEDEEFRRWIQTHDPAWELAEDRPHPRRRADGPRDRWWVFRYPIPSQEGWPVIWVSSALLALSQQANRRERIAKALEGLENLAGRLARGRSRLKDKAEAQRAADELLGAAGLRRYIEAEVHVDEQHRYRQATSGRPGPQTQYRRLGRRGLGDAEDVDPLHEEQPLLAGVYGASVRGRIATGRRAGRRIVRLGDRIDAEDLGEITSPRCASVAGVSLHANVCVPAGDRLRLERLCRYVARSPLAFERLSRLADGRLLYRLKNRWRDGSTHVLLEPEELLEKLVALVPPPRFHLVRYHGVFAPRSAWRASVVPAAASAPVSVQPCDHQLERTAPAGATDHPPVAPAGRRTGARPRREPAAGPPPLRLSRYYGRASRSAPGRGGPRPAGRRHGTPRDPGPGSRVEHRDRDGQPRRVRRPD